MNASTTVILFWVSVPVLSVQILFAPPIVSDACSYRTRLFYFRILPTEYASAIVTASGRPSGIAMTTIVIPKTIALIMSFNISLVNTDSPFTARAINECPMDATIVKIAAMRPIFPISDY